MHPTPSSLRATRWRTSAAVLLLAGGLAACSSVPAPAGEMAVARSTVERVSALPAAAAAAPIELQQARDKLARAERALADGKHTQARRLAQEAEADARLAETKATAASNRQALEEVRRANQTLGSEIGGAPPPAAIQRGGVPPQAPTQ